jgi:hypothetical protein
MRSQQVDGTATVAEKGAAQPKPAADPRVEMHDRIAQLFNVVEAEEGDPSKKATWQHGVNLRELGNMQLQTGDLADGRLCLKAGNEVMYKATDKPKEAELTITEGLVDYGKALLIAPPKQPVAYRQRDLREANEVFGSVVDRASHEHRAPEDIAAMLQLKANTDMAMADTNDPKTPAGKTAFVADMQSAMTDLTSGLDMLKDRHQPETILTEAKLHSERAFAETQLNALDRNNWYDNVWGAGLVGRGQYDVAGDYKQSIDLWHQVKPTDRQGQVDKDEELLTTLARYKTALSSAGDKTGAAAADKEEQAILGNHPNWKMKI